jgi:hypothetical protein
MEERCSNPIRRRLRDQAEASPRFLEISDRNTTADDCNTKEYGKDPFSDKQAHQLADNNR